MRPTALRSLEQKDAKPEEIVMRIPGICLGLLLAGGVIELSAQSRVAHVQFVDESGRIVDDLEASEVALTERGEQRAIVKFEAPESPFRLGVVLDVGPGVHRIQDDVLSAFEQFFLRWSEFQDVLLLTFDEEVYVDAEWSSDSRKALAAVQSLRDSKVKLKTILRDAIVMAATQKFDAENFREAMILITDGFDLGSSASWEKALQTIQSERLLTYVLHYDGREVYRFMQNPQDDLIFDLPPGTTGGDVGGIFVGSPRSRERDWAEYKVGQQHRNGKEWLQKLAAAASGTYHELPTPSLLLPALERVRGQLDGVYSLTFESASAAADMVYVTTTREGIYGKVVAVQ